MSDIIKIECHENTVVDVINHAENRIFTELLKNTEDEEKTEVMANTNELPVKKYERSFIYAIG